MYISSEDSQAVPTATGARLLARLTATESPWDSKSRSPGISHLVQETLAIGLDAFLLVHDHAGKKVT